MRVIDFGVGVGDHEAYMVLLQPTRLLWMVFACMILVMMAI